MIDLSATVLSMAAVGISASVFVTQRLDSRRQHRADEREQAEQIAGWVDVDPQTRDVTLYLKNASTQPIYDVVCVVRTVDDSSDYELAELVPLVPPDTTVTQRYPPTESTDLARVNHRLYFTFRDGQNRAWMRDTHGRLWPATRPVDKAPRPNIAGRIER